MGVLLDQTKEINIKFYWVEQTAKHGHSRFYFIRSDKDLQHWKSRDYLTTSEITAKRADDETFTCDKEISELNTSWSLMTWAQENECYSLSTTMRTDNEGIGLPYVDPVKFRALKLSKCLKRWDLKDGSKDVPLTNDNLDCLYPDIANELITQFDRITMFREGELKN